MGEYFFDEKLQQYYLIDAVWESDEGHFDPHYYTVEVYKYLNGNFSPLKKLKTSQKYCPYDDCETPFSRDAILREVKVNL